MCKSADLLGRKKTGGLKIILVMKTNPDDSTKKFSSVSTLSLTRFRKVFPPIPRLGSALFHLIPKLFHKGP